MRRSLCFIISAIVLSVFTGCADKREVLLKAESVMFEQPDSALSLLNGIDSRSLKTKQTRAKYALLLSQAKDKCFIDETNDSLINIAVSYYKERGCSSDRMKSYYYLGRVHYNAGLYPQANVAFTLAESDAAALSDYFYAGLIYRGIAWVYNSTFNHKAENEYAVKSYESFVKAGYDLYAAYALLGIGVSKLNRKQYHEAIEYLINAVESAQKLNDVSLEANARQTLSIIYNQLNEHQKVFEHLRYVRDTLKYQLDYEWYTNYASACIFTNQLDSAAYYLESARNLVEENSTDYQKYQNQIYYLDRKKGDYKSALDTYISIAMYQDSLARSILEESVIAYQRDDLKKQVEHNALKLKQNRLTGVICLLVILIVALFVYQRMAAKNHAIQHYMDIANNLEKELFDKTKNADEMGAEIAQMNEQINRLFVARFATIDKLSNTYYEMHHTQRVKDAIYASVKKEIDIFSNKESVHKLEEIVNLHRKDIMNKTRSTMPQFSDADLRLLCYIYAGFSAKAISIFTGDSVGNIYVKKSRLKAKIISSDSKYKDEMLQFGGMLDS